MVCLASGEERLAQAQAQPNSTPSSVIYMHFVHGGEEGRTAIMPFPQEGRESGVIGAYFTPTILSTMKVPSIVFMRAVLSIFEQLNFSCMSDIFLTRRFEVTVT